VAMETLRQLGTVSPAEPSRVRLRFKSGAEKSKL